MKEVLQKIHEYSLEEIMSERFSRYSKTIIQDRALPDVRDGLKPVQRRILYTMHKDRNTYDKPHRKSAKTVGNVMGEYHPHGDSSIYEAMVRMSQYWKQNAMYIDMHGNNGSMDGDSPAAMRYTEARLSKISSELLKDLEKDTVLFAPNYDDTTTEPTVLPAKFPNLLVNGASGISAGYATNIPPHNLGEIIDATIKRIDSPNCHFDSILSIVKGPDFPTGGIVYGMDGIIEAFKTGKGKIVLRGLVEEETKNKKTSLIIKEIPYDVNKLNLVKKMEDLRIDKKVEGINEVRDESDRDGLRIAIDLKKEANKDLILKYFYKNTDLQVSYNYNMVSIVNKRPVKLGIIEILDAYISHQKKVIINRTNFDLRVLKEKLHILEGLIKAISILDDVIKTIRKSKNKSDAKDNLVKEYKFTEKQADAIVMLQLYKLTNTDVTSLEEEVTESKKMIEYLESVINSEDKLKSVMKEELRSVKKEYATDRLTKIEEEIPEVKLDSAMMVPKEDVIVSVTKDGYVKRVSKRSYSASEEKGVGLKDSDVLIGVYELNTVDTMLFFTDHGNYLYVPVHELPDLKWKDLGNHVSNIVEVSSYENIIGCVPVTNFDEEKYITIFTKDGMVKRSLLKEYQVQRYSKPIVAIKLKKDDKAVSVTTNDYENTLVVTKNGYSLVFDTSDIPVTATKTSGVKSINLRSDEVVSGHIYNGEESLIVFTDKKTAKRVKLEELIKSNRARRGSRIIKDIKTNPYLILTTFVSSKKEELYIRHKDTVEVLMSTEIPFANTDSKGTTITKGNILGVYKLYKQEESKKEVVKETVEEVVEEEIETLDLDEIDNQIMTIDDFLNEV